MLKKIAAIVFIILMFFSETSAFGAQGIRPGLQLGINYASLNYDNPMDVWDPGWKVGYSVGGFVEVPITSHVSLQPGLCYVQLGNKVEVDINADQQEGRIFGNFKIIQNYLSLPVLFKVNFLKKHLFFLLAGPELGFLVSASAKESQTINFGSLSYQEDCTTDKDISDRMESYNISLNGGLGLEFAISSRLFRIQLNYLHGLVETAKEESWITNWKTREVRTSVGYMF